MQAADYRKLSHKDHIREIADSYIGGDQKVPRRVRLLSEEGKFYNATIDLPEAIEFLFLEILSNASDNINRSREANVKPGQIKVSMDETRILVENGGLPIPIVEHPEYNLYIPELIFGNLLTSSNYNDQRTGAGRNGYGAKLVNLYSLNFSVEIADATNHKLYIQNWEERMEICHPPEITEYKGASSSVKVLFQLDLARFGYSTYPPEAVALFAAHVADTSLVAKVPTFFNERKFHLLQMKAYAELYQAHNPLFYKSEEEGIELCLIDTQQAQVIAFANTKLTRQGGTHVEAVYQALKPFLEMLNGTAGKKLTLKDIKPKLSFIVNVRVKNPRWADQMKTGLKSPALKFQLPPALLKKMLHWNLTASLLETSSKKSFSASDGKKRKHLGLDKLQDANHAGTKESPNCSLYVVEGESASGYAETFRDSTQGKDYIGIYPLRGKMLNVMKANKVKVANNKVINRIKEALGLQEGLDYTEEKNLDTLRYGHLVLLVDEDLDSRHIIGLILNCFYCRFPSLLQVGYIKYLRTPIIRLVKGKKILNFFSEGEYQQWKESHPEYARYEHLYCKGLGSSEPAHVKEDAKAPRVVFCLYDDKIDAAMHLAFEEKLADKRKEWIEKFQAETFRVFTIEGFSQQPISDFIHEELIQFSLYNMLRSIPRMIDGLKISQRKILWGVMNEWKNWHNGKTFKKMKVKILASNVAGFTAYKHGEDCLGKAIMLMAQDYVGSNNLAYLQKNGMFGSRSLLGENAADTRYPYTSPQEWLRYVYRKEDEPLLVIGQDEDMKVEPHYFLPILPMVLINGACGIGTGYSTFIPNYFPLDVVDWLSKRILGQERPDILPWYQGFKGSIQVDETSMATQGLFEEVRPGVTLVTEIPIGVSIQGYSSFILSLVEKKIIKDFRDLSTTDEPSFEIIGLSRPSVAKLKLKSSFGLTNMVLLDLHGRAKRYKDVEEILEDFYQTRLPFYEQRKSFSLQTLNEKITKVSHKIRLVQAVVNEEIIVNKRRKEDLLADLRLRDIPEGLLKEVYLYSLTQEEVEKLLTEKSKLQENYALLEARSSADIWLEELEEFRQYYYQQNKETCNSVLSAS